MKKTTMTAIAILMITALAVAGPGMSGKRSHQGMQGMQMHGGNPGMILQMLDNEEMNLSDSQREQIEEIIEAEELWTIDHRASIEKMELRMRSQRRSDDPDLDVMERSIDQISTARAEGMKRHLRSRQQVEEILNDEQLGLLKSMQLEHQRGRRGGQDNRELKKDRRSNQHRR